MPTRMIFEQPLNERVRTFLRIEFLFDQVEHYVTGTSEWDNRHTITTLLDISEFLTRTDLRSELIKELERHSSTLVSLEHSPGVDHHRLKFILSEIGGYLTTLRNSEYQPGQVLRQDEFINSVKQRVSIPGGTCNFDLPGYYHWLQKPEAERVHDLNAWRGDLSTICKSIKLCLQMIRNSTNPSRQIAEKGFFQKPIESGSSCQLIRVMLPADSHYYPEISGGRHRFTIRFMEQPTTGVRPAQTGNDVSFELHCCIL